MNFTKITFSIFLIDEIIHRKYRQNCLKNSLKIEFQHKAKWYFPEYIYLSIAISTKTK